MKKIKFLSVALILMFALILVGCEKSYTVKFETNCDQTIASQTVKANEKVTKPEVITKEGYNFVGWFNGDVEYTFTESVTSDLTLQAKWDEIKYIIKFETNCDQTIASQTVKANEKITKPEAITKEGYNFVGWFNGDVEYTFSENVTSDLTLVAKWEEAKYTVKFETNCDQTIEAQIVKENDIVVKPQTLAKAGYKFIGWYNGDIEYTFTEGVTSDLTLVAKWEKVETYTVKFMANGELVAEVIVEAGKDATAPKAPKIEGKSFVKWDGKYTSVTKDCEVVAVYENAKYAVQFKVDGANYGSYYYVEYGQDCEKPTDPEKAGYKFIGWDKEYTNVKTNLVINAKFEVLEYSVKFFNGDKQITLEPSKYTIEDTITLADYNINDYYFYGWYKNNTYEGDAITEIFSGTTGDLTLYALNVKADINGGVECWGTDFPSSHDPSKGIDAISNLPEMFEMDFYKYLNDNNYLTDERINASCQAASWSVFSGTNPLHNGDPLRIWNDTSTNGSGGADGYVAVFLYETIELNDDLTVKSVKGGFLGTEPYKTKYNGLLNLLVIMYQHKVENDNYTNLSANTNASRALMGFVIDGYFYGTQGAGSSYLKAARSVIPGINFSYKLSGTTIEKVTYEINSLPTPVREGFVFSGWCLDKEGTKPLSSNAPTNLCTIYAKWEQIK